jgi:hypothetical protein
MLWIILAILVVLGGGTAAYQLGKRRGQKELSPARQAEARALLERTIKDARVDDVVQEGGHDWLVEGLVLYDEDGHRWRAIRTVDSPEERWFVIGLDRTGPPTIRAMRRVALAIEGYPAEELTVEGKSFRLGQRGNATAQLSGVFTDLPGVTGPVRDLGLRCRWWRYAGGASETVLVEQWGESTRVLIGTLVSENDVDLLAGT